MTPNKGRTQRPNVAIKCYLIFPNTKPITSQTKQNPYLCVLKATTNTVETIIIKKPHTLHSVYCILRATPHKRGGRERSWNFH